MVALSTMHGCCAYKKIFVLARGSSTISVLQINELSLNLCP